MSDACAKLLQQTVRVCGHFLRLVVCTKPVEIINFQKIEEIRTYWSEIFAKLEFNGKLEAEEASRPQ